MFSTEMLVTLALSAAVLLSLLTVAAFFYVRRAYAYVEQIATWAASDWQRVERDSKVGDLEQRVAELEDTQASHAASIKRLRSKYAMRDMRERKAELEQQNDNPGEFEDNEKAAYKSRLRLHAKKTGLLR